MKPGYAALVALGIQSWAELPYAECFTLTLASGAVLRYTNYDVPVWLNGLYFAANAVRIDDLKFKQTTGLDIDQQEIDLIYSATDNVLGVPWGVAIRNHVLDGCYVQRDRAFFNPYTTWLDPLHGATAAGGVTLFRGRVADISAYGRTSAQINLKSDLVLLDIDYPRNIWQASCLHTLYDSGCGLSRGAYQGTGAVGAGATNVIVPYAIGGTGGVINVSMSGAAGAPIARVVLTSPASINNTYNSAPPVTVTDPTGSGAVVVALLSNNRVFSGVRALYGFMVLNGGSGYTNPTISMPGGATAQAVLASGAQTVSGLSVGAGGNGYSQAAQLVFTGGDGTGAAGKLIISSAGVITGVVKTSGGINYATAPTATIVDGAAENFNQGTLMFQGGQNAGTLVQIKSATPTALVLANPLQYVPAAGDVFNIWPGCDHTLGAGGCAKFNNTVNFRGFPWVPPADYAF
jgi:hypothetical protein